MYRLANRQGKNLKQKNSHIYIHSTSVQIFILQLIEIRLFGENTTVNKLDNT